MARNRDPFASALRALRERAVSGAFSPGRPIIILDEAEALGLSTTPIREALAWLGGEGLIERAPAGGYIGLRVDAATLAGRYRMRLHCLARGVERSLQSGGAAPKVFSDPALLFRTLVASTADPMLIQTFDRVQATLERFAPAEAELLDDMPEALEQISALLSAGDTASAATRLEAFHERRIRAAPILTERGPIAVEAG